ncbi:hypothetical protein [Bacillus chungangensis]|uniref:Spy/CpxP family protein refolding chaperone n=1 Tax=Bacillus chungangensis TaxID=587633 RepID=A0ABT9WVE7_9BACI|nr:hypothetical protein [Bacillus chungangensis]MDQ0177194.1 Spy/CpxP family protein refolding chaperone [Bacillus chungangensis]
MYKKLLKIIGTSVMASLLLVGCTAADNDNQNPPPENGNNGVDRDMNGNNGVDGDTNGNNGGDRDTGLNGNTDDNDDTNNNLK